MTLEERIEQLETHLEQIQQANEQLLMLIFLLALDPKWRTIIETPRDASDWLRMLAGAQEDQENHIAASVLSRVAGQILD